MILKIHHCIPFLPLLCSKCLIECYGSLPYCIIVQRHSVAAPFCTHSHLITRNLVCWKPYLELEIGTTPKVLWTRCLLSMLLLTRPLHWHSASLCTWLWNLFTEGADFSCLLPVYFTVWIDFLTPWYQHFIHSSSIKNEKIKNDAITKNVGSNTTICSSQGWPPERGKGMRTASTKEQAGPSACRELWGSTQGHIQHAQLPGPSPLQWRYPLCQDCASGQGLHERGT